MFAERRKPCVLPFRIVLRISMWKCTPPKGSIQGRLNRKALRMLFGFFNVQTAWRPSLFDRDIFAPKNDRTARSYNPFSQSSLLTSPVVLDNTAQKIVDQLNDVRELSLLAGAYEVSLLLRLFRTLSITIILYLDITQSPLDILTVLKALQNRKEEQQLARQQPLLLDSVLSPFRPIYKGCYVLLTKFPSGISSFECSEEVSSVAVENSQLPFNILSTIRNLHRMTVSDYYRDFRELALFRTLRHLSIESSSFSDSDFAYIAALPELRILRIQGRAALHNVKLEKCKALEDVTISFRKKLEAEIQACTFPEQLQRIGDSSLCFCPIKKVDLSRTTVAAIGHSFCYETALKTLALPRTLSEIGMMFASSSFLTHLDISHCLRLDSLPEDFCSFSPLEQCFLPHSLTSIGANCFVGCSLHELQLNHCHNLCSISNAFCKKCRKLERCTLPPSLEFMGQDFLAETSVKEIDLRKTKLKLEVFERIGSVKLERCLLPQSEFLKRLGDDVFCSYKLLEEVDLTPFRCLETIGKRFCAQTGSLKKCCFPACLAEIGDGALHSSSVQQLDLSHCRELRSIGDDFGRESAIVQCEFPLTSSLTQLRHGFLALSNVEKIDLRKCSGLRTIGREFCSESNVVECWLPQALGEVGPRFLELCPIRRIDFRDTQLTALPRMFLQKAEHVEACWLPSKLIATPDCFLTRAPLKLLDISYCQQMTTVGSDFCADASLTQCLLPSSLVTIDKSCFAGSRVRSLDLTMCNALESVGELFGARSFATECFVPASLKAIKGQFLHGTLVVSLDLSHCVNLEEIGAYFASYSKLKKCLFPNSLKKIGAYFLDSTPIEALDLGGCTHVEVEENFCSNTSALSSLTLPAHWARIPKGFLMKSGIRSIDLRPLDIECIGDDFCSSAQVVECFLPCTVSRIGDKFLSMCPITTIDLVNLHVLIGIGRDFCAHSALTSCWLPPQIQEFGCGFLSHTPLLETNIGDCRLFTKISGGFLSGVTSTVPSPKLPSQVCRIEAQVFCNSRLRFVDLAECSELFVVGNAFCSCSAVEKCLFPSSIRQIGERCFERSLLQELDLSHCKKLFSIDVEFCCATPISSLLLPSSLTKIGECFLNRCHQLQKLDLSLCALREIPTKFCVGCSLTEISLGHNVTAIGSMFLVRCPIKRIDLRMLTQLASIGNGFCQLSSVEECFVPNSLNSIGTHFLQQCPIQQVDLRGCKGLQVAKQADNGVKLLIAEE